MPILGDPTPCQAIFSTDFTAFFIGDLDREFVHAIQILDRAPAGPEPGLQQHPIQHQQDQSQILVQNLYRMHKLVFEKVVISAFEMHMSRVIISY